MKQSIKNLIVGTLAVTLIAGSAFLALNQTQPASRISLKDVRTDKATLFAGKCPGGRTWFMEQADSQNNLPEVRFVD